MQKNKAIIFDLDGTAVQDNEYAMPSKRLIYAVKKAQKNLKVIAATGRTYLEAKDIIFNLKLKDPSIVSEGTQIINSKTGDIYWEQKLKTPQLKEISEIIKLYPYSIYFDDKQIELAILGNKILDSVRLVSVIGVEKQDAIELISKLGKVDKVFSQIGGVWVNEKADLHISHIEGNKKNAIAKLLSSLNIKKEETIGVGDGFNDLLMFESVGFKVAMNNGIEELKAKADYITPSIAEDGLAQFIEEFAQDNS